MPNISNRRVVPVRGFEGRYSICDSGVLISHIRRKDHVMRPFDNGLGYYHCQLSYGIPKEKGVKHSFSDYRIHQSIHRLVAIAFVPNPYGFSEVEHIDQIKHHNNYENLLWCDRSYNMSSMVLADNSGNAKLKVSDISVIRSRFMTETKDMKPFLGAGYKKGSTNKPRTRFDVYNEIAKDYGVAASTIKHVVNRINWSSIL